MTPIIASVKRDPRGLSADEIKAIEAVGQRWSSRFHDELRDQPLTNLFSPVWMLRLMGRTFVPAIREILAVAWSTRPTGSKR